MNRMTTMYQTVRIAWATALFCCACLCGNLQAQGSIDSISIYEAGSTQGLAANNAAVQITPGWQLQSVDLESLSRLVGGYVGWPAERPTVEALGRALAAWGRSNGIYFNLLTSSSITSSLNIKLIPKTTGPSYLTFSRNEVSFEATQTGMPSPGNVPMTIERNPYPSIHVEGSPEYALTRVHKLESDIAIIKSQLVNLTDRIPAVLPAHEMEQRVTRIEEQNQSIQQTLASIQSNIEKMRQMRTEAAYNPAPPSQVIPPQPTQNTASNPVPALSPEDVIAMQIHNGAKPSDFSQADVINLPRQPAQPTQPTPISPNNTDVSYTTPPQAPTQPQPSNNEPPGRLTEVDKQKSARGLRPTASAEPTKKTATKPTANIQPAPAQGAAPTSSNTGAILPLSRIMVSSETNESIVQAGSQDGSIQMQLPESAAGVAARIEYIVKSLLDKPFSLNDTRKAGLDIGVALKEEGITGYDVILPRQDPSQGKLEIRIRPAVTKMP